MKKPEDRHQQGALEDVAPDEKAHLAFALMRIGAELLDLLGEFDHIDRAWVNQHLYLSTPNTDRPSHL